MELSSFFISACSSFPTGTKSLVIFPMCIIAAVFLNTLYLQITVIIFVKHAALLLFLLSEAEDVKGLIGELHVLAIVDGGHGDLALGHVPVVQDVVGQEAWRMRNVS